MSTQDIWYPTRCSAANKICSQRASNTFNQVVEAKGSKVCSYVEKYAKLKNQTLKKSAGTQKFYVQRNTPGVGNFSN